MKLVELIHPRSFKELYDIAKRISSGGGESAGYASANRLIRAFEHSEDAPKRNKEVGPAVLSNLFKYGREKNAAVIVTDAETADRFFAWQDGPQDHAVISKPETTAPKIIRKITKKKLG